MADIYNPPFPLGSRVQVAWYWFAWAVMAPLWSAAYRWVPGNASRVPRDDEGLLLLTNHTSASDPFWAAFWIFRRVSFMTSSHLFHLPVLSWLLPLCGCFPKAKFVKDKASMRTLDDRYNAGDAVVLFPEGTRTFDGRTRPVLPGIGRLIKRIDARVVTARILNGHLFQPRWASYPRWIPVRVDYDELITFGENDTVEHINQVLSERIRIDPDVDAPRGSFGFRMAHGLPDYLWACPACFTQDALQVARDDGNAVVCSSCSERWTVDTSSRMAGAKPMRVHQAFDRIVEDVGSPPRVGEGTLALSGPGGVTTMGHGKKNDRWDGQLELTADELRVVRGDEVLWARPITELKAVSVEFQNRLTVRHDDHLFEVVPSAQSSLKWGHFLKQWVALAAE
ncbi:MAG: 1-acyl-sn-glycerol-3-phosphate acyltransferase [Proteobacteria bacterium]|nr:1-acyl-sn-glycerol-3-phosphate acyltransferase [Pseudomonadota bacterium]MCP4920715.1 1-acyl-sn-glycerol-3-phosphate acyltransferase [Pseudomonadota bacterium]